MGTSKKSYHWIYFLVQPFFTLVYYLKNFRHPAAKNIIWAFTVFFGMTIAVGEESQGSDINRYMDEMVYLHGISFNFGQAIDYFEKSGEIDILRTFLSIVVSRFTDNGYLLLIVYGIIFGYFFSRNMWFILNRTPGKLKTISIILIFCLFLETPIWTIGGFRFNTAIHVFIFGLLPFLYSGKKRSLVWCYLTPFIFHFAFVAPLLILTLYLVLGNRIRLYFIFFIISFIFSGIEIQQVNNLLENYAPEVFLERSESYRDPDKVAEFREGGETERVWYAQYYRKLLYWSLSLFLIILYSKNRKFLRNQAALEKMLGFSLLIFGFANVLNSIPSGGRFLHVAALLSLALLIIFIQNYGHKSMTTTVKIATPFLVLFIIVAVRTSFYYMSLQTVISNPAFSLFTIGENISINDILK